MSPADEWIEASRRIAGAATVAPGAMKTVPGSGYANFVNCPDSAFENAARE